jgi:multidrug efflux pump
MPKLITFVLVIGFTFMVLAVRLERVSDPLIMLSVPLSITGALLALKLTGNTLNVYSQIGVVARIGLITKHGILIVESATRRLRPILVITGVMANPLIACQRGLAQER